MQENQAPEPPRQQVVELIDKLVAELKTEEGQRQFAAYRATLQKTRAGQLKAMVDELPKEPSQFLTHLNALYRELRQQVQPRLEELIHESLQRKDVESHVRRGLARQLNVVLRNAHLAPMESQTKELGSFSSDKQVRLLSRKAPVTSFGNVENLAPIELVESPRLEAPDHGRW